jgi:hypothetical protein
VRAMNDQTARRGLGRRDAAQELSEVPAMPVISPDEQAPDTLFPLLDGVSPTIGWQFRSRAKGGDAFVVIRRTGFGSLKVTESFPLTEEGWVSVWRSLAGQNPAAVTQIRAMLQAREDQAARLNQQDADLRWLSGLDARAFVILHDMAYLGGYLPHPSITAGERCDVRFLADRFMVFAHRSAKVLAEVPYGGVQDVQIGGPGLVKKGGGFIGGGIGLVGAADGIAIATVLNMLTTRTSITTILRIQGTDCELFLLHTKVTPEQLRIELSRPLGAIRSARTARSGPVGPIRDDTSGAPSSPVEELAKLADMLQKGLLTREEFDQMKGRLLGPPSLWSWMRCLRGCLPRSGRLGSSRCGCLAGRELPGGPGSWCSSPPTRSGRDAGAPTSTTR